MSLAPSEASPGDRTGVGDVSEGTADSSDPGGTGASGAGGLSPRESRHDGTGPIGHDLPGPSLRGVVCRAGASGGSARVPGDGDGAALRRRALGPPGGGRRSGADRLEVCPRPDPGRPGRPPRGARGVPRTLDWERCRAPPVGGDFGGLQGAGGAAQAGTATDRLDPHPGSLAGPQSRGASRRDQAGRLGGPRPGGPRLAPSAHAPRPVRAL